MGRIRRAIPVAVLADRSHKRSQVPDNCPVGLIVGGHAGRRRERGAAPRSRIGLQCRYWSRMNARACPSAASVVAAFVPPRTATASKSTDGIVSSVLSGSTVPPSSVSMAASLGATSRTIVSASVRAFCVTATEWPSAPGATSIGIRRPRILPSPGRAVRDRAGDRVTSGVGGSLTAAWDAGAPARARRRLAWPARPRRSGAWPPSARGSRGPGPW